jgi:hypothetical protein
MKHLPPVTPRAHVDLRELRSLVASRRGPVVSLYVPLSRSLPESRGNAAAYDGAVSEAERRLEEAGLAAAEAQAVRKQLAAVETDPRRLAHPVSGLAVFHDRAALHAYALAVEVARQVAVAETFALRPLLAAAHRDRRHRVLALSNNRVALYAGDVRGVEPIALPELPESLEAALGSEKTQRQLQVSTTQAGAGTPRFYSQDSGRDERKLDLERFHARIARALEADLEGRETPLVLVATQAHQSGLRAALRLGSLLGAGVHANPDHLSPSELHAQTWPLVEHAVAAADAAAASEYERAVNLGKGLHRIGDVAAAAAAGRVRRLWIGRDESVPGGVDLASGALVGGRPHDDVLDGIVTLVLRHGGEVIAGAPVPAGGAVAAELF